MLVFTSQFRLYIVRERRRFWSSRPGRELLVASMATVLGFAILGVYGIIVPPVTVYEALFILVFSALLTFSLDFPKYYIFKKNSDCKSSKSLKARRWSELRNESPEVWASSLKFSLSDGLGFVCT